MTIWFSNYTLDDVRAAMDKNMSRFLDIELTELGDNFLSGTMPVDQRTRNPMGMLHGGASCVLAESLASYASYLCVNPDTHGIVGLEINANHLRSVLDGHVYGTARVIHIGCSTHVWDVRIMDEQQRPVCISRMTVAILDKNND